MNSRVRITAIPAVLAAGALAALPGGLKVLAHDTPQTTPQVDQLEAAWKDIDLPEIHLDVIKDAIEGMPQSLNAGRYRVIVNGEPGPEDFLLGPMFGNLPNDMTIDDILDQVAESAETGLVPAFYEITMPGGPIIFAPAGQTSSVGIVEFTEGTWFVSGYWMAQPPVLFSVTGDAPDDEPEPESTVTFTIGEMTIDITDGTFATGTNLIRVDNIGAQPHFVELQKVPDGTTKEDYGTFLESMMMGTPDPDGIALEDIAPVAFIQDQSGGTTQWLAVEVHEPGTYAAVCFVLDPEIGTPHAMMGMYTVIEAAEESLSNQGFMLPE